MTWRIWGTKLYTTDIDGTSKAEAMGITPSDNYVIRGIRTWFVFYNGPIFTALYFRIYEAQNSAAGKLIATSTNSFVPNDVMVVEDYAAKGVGFTFEYISLKANTEYFLLPYATGYTGNETSHIAWVKGYPDPEYRSGVTPTFEGLFTNPYRIAIVGSPL